MRVTSPYGTRTTVGGVTTYQGHNGYQYTQRPSTFNYAGRNYSGYSRTVIVDNRPVYYNYRAVPYGHVYMPSYAFGYHYGFWGSPFGMPYYPPAYCAFCAPVYGYWGVPYTSPLGFLAGVMVADIIYGNYQARLAQQRALQAQMLAQQQALQQAQQNSQYSEAARLQGQVTAMQSELQRLDAELAAAKTQNGQVQARLDAVERRLLERQTQAAAKAIQERRSITLEDVLASPEMMEHRFVVSSDSDISAEAVNRPGQVCSLAGDIIKFSADERPDLSSGSAKMHIVTSSDGGCAAGDTVIVKMSDLQDMLNDFMTKVEAKMQAIQSQSGKK